MVIAHLSQKSIKNLFSKNVHGAIDKFDKG